MHFSISFLELKIRTNKQTNKQRNKQTDKSLRFSYIDLTSEIDLFRKTGTLSKNLNLVLEALNSIPPTSVESERAFSAAGLFITKNMI